MTTYFTSDTHFNHRLLTALRGFADSKETATESDLVRHNESIVTAWNNTVNPDDIVWHLGDVTLGNIDAVSPWLSQLHGHKRLILGNHDKAHPMMKEQSIKHFHEALNYFEWVGTEAMVALSPGLNKPNIPVMLSHFPYQGDHFDRDRFERWRLRNTGMPLLHGHTHASEAVTSAKEIHVGWDTWFRPVSEHEVLELLHYGKLA